MLLKETLKETNRLKSNCTANSSIYALLMRLRLLLLFRNGLMAIALNPAPKQHRNDSCEYAICEITNPQSYCGEHSGISILKQLFRGLHDQLLGVRMYVRLGMNSCTKASTILGSLICCKSERLRSPQRYLRSCLSFSLTSPTNCNSINQVNILHWGVRFRYLTCCPRRGNP